MLSKFLENTVSLPRDRVVEQKVRSSCTGLFLFATVLFLLSGCVSPPYGQKGSVFLETGEQSGTAGSPVLRVEKDTMDTERGPYGVTTVVLRTDAVVLPVMDGTEVPDTALLVMTTPWEKSESLERVPVGVFAVDGTVLSPPVPPYWALHFDGPLTTVDFLPQDGLIPEGLVAGGFFPLVLEGRSVASRFPGGSIRAARVALAVACKHGGGYTVAIVTTEGSGLLRQGPTTIEFAEWLQREGYNRALNLDGGRSAAVVLPDGGVLPRGVVFRRPGPVGIAIFVVP